ncbi:unnamed protein product [Closterium sp. Naga37s-1]|nr:unnamed protein product [Closterium sp. Naga37s-1]
MHLQDVILKTHLEVQGFCTVRWLSRGDAVNRFCDVLPVLIWMWTKEKDGMEKLATSFKFHYMLYLLADVLQLLNGLNLAFQKQTVDITEVKNHVDKVKTKLSQYYVEPSASYGPNTSRLNKFLAAHGSKDKRKMELKGVGGDGKPAKAEIELHEDIIDPENPGGGCDLEACVDLARRFAQRLIKALGKRMADLRHFDGVGFFTPDKYPFRAGEQDTWLQHHLTELLDMFKNQLPDKEEKQKPDRADQVARLMGLLHRDHTKPHDPPPSDEDNDQDDAPAAADKPAGPSAAASRSSNSGRRPAPESADGSSASARRGSAPPSPSHGMAPSVSWEGQCGSRGATAESPRYANAPPQQPQMRGRPRPQAVQAPSPRGAQAVSRSFNDGGAESPHTPPDQPPPRIGPTASSPHSGAGPRALPRPKTGEQLQGPPLPSPRGTASPKTWSSNPDGAAPGHAAPRKNRAPSIRVEGSAGDDGEGRCSGPPVASSGGTTPRGGAARPGSSTGRREPDRASSMGDFPDARVADGGTSGALMPPLSPLGSAAGGARSAAGARGRRAATKHASLGNQEYDRMHVATSPGPGNPSLSPLNAPAVPRAGVKQAAGGTRAGLTPGASPPSGGDMVRAAEGAHGGARRASKHMSLGKEDYLRMEAAGSGYLPSPSPPPPHARASAGPGAGAAGAAAAGGAHAGRVKPGRRASMGADGMEAMMRAAAAAASDGRRKSVDDTAAPPQGWEKSWIGGGEVKGGERRSEPGRERTRKEQRNEAEEGRRAGEEGGAEGGAADEVVGEDPCGSPVLGVQGRAEEAAWAEESAESVGARSGGEVSARAGSGKKGSLARSLTEDEEARDEAPAERPRGKSKAQASPKASPKGPSGRRLARPMEEDEGAEDSGGAAKAMAGGRGKAAAEARGAGKGRVKPRSMEADEGGGEGECQGRSGERTVRGEDAKGLGAGCAKRGSLARSLRDDDEEKARAVGKAGGSLVRCLSDDEEEDAHAVEASKAEGHVRGAEGEQHSAAGGAKHKAVIGKSSRKGSSLVRSMTEDGDDEADTGPGRGHDGGESKSGREVAGRGAQVREQRKGKVRGEGASPKGRAGAERESGEGVARGKAVGEAEEVRGDKVRAVGKEGGSLVRCLSDDEEDADAGKASMAEGHMAGGESEQHSAGGRAKQKAVNGTCGRKSGLLARSMTEDADEDADTGVAEGHGGGESEGGREGAGRGVQVRERTKGQACAEGEGATRQARGEMENGEGVVQGKMVSGEEEVHGDTAHGEGMAGGSLVRCLSDDEGDAHAAQGSTAEGSKAEGHVAGGDNEQHADAGGAKQKAASANAGRKSKLLMRSMTEDESEEEAEVPAKPMPAKPMPAKVVDEPKAASRAQGARGGQGGGRGAGVTRRAPREAGQRAGRGVAGQQGRAEQAAQMAPAEELPEAQGGEKEKGKRGIGGLMSRLKVLAT